VAHFHNVIIGGVLFGAFAGYNFWFPKAFGFTLHEGWGRATFWCWLIGFYLAFMPLYLLGLMGATRRMQHYGDTGWQPLFVVALAGALVICAGIACTVIQLVVSIRTRAGRRDLTGDPWDGRSLEWATPSPPPEFNFATPVQVFGRDAFWAAKRDGLPSPGAPDMPAPSSIAVPRPTATGFFIAFFAVVLGFAMVWHIWWMAIAGLLGIVAVALKLAWRASDETMVDSADVAAMYQEAA
jgi:cytochrome o ubiquinol oxidase subunit 1